MSIASDDDDDEEEQGEKGPVASGGEHRHEQQHVKTQPYRRVFAQAGRYLEVQARQEAVVVVIVDLEQWHSQCATSSHGRWIHEDIQSVPVGDSRQLLLGQQRNTR